MNIPKIDFSKATETLDKFKSEEGMIEILDKFTEEQGSEQELKLLLIGLINPDVMRGFLVAYMLFRNALIEQEMESFK